MFNWFNGWFTTIKKINVYQKPDLDKQTKEILKSIEERKKSQFEIFFKNKNLEGVENIIDTPIRKIDTYVDIEMAIKEILFKYSGFTISKDLINYIKKEINDKYKEIFTVELDYKPTGFDITITLNKLEVFTTIIEED